MYQDTATGCLIDDDDPYLVLSRPAEFSDRIHFSVKPGEILYPIQLSSRKEPPGIHPSGDEWLVLTYKDFSKVVWMGWRKNCLRRLQLSYPIGPEGFEYIGLGRCLRDVGYHDTPLIIPQLNQIYYLYKLDRWPVGVKVRNLDESWCTSGHSGDDHQSSDAVWDALRFKLLSRLDNSLPVTGPQSYPLIFSERDLL